MGIAAALAVAVALAAEPDGDRWAEEPEEPPPAEPEPLHFNAWQLTHEVGAAVGVGGLLVRYIPQAGSLASNIELSCSPISHLRASAALGVAWFGPQNGVFMRAAAGFDGVLARPGVLLFAGVQAGPAFLTANQTLPPSAQLLLRVRAGAELVRWRPLTLGVSVTGNVTPSDYFSSLELAVRVGYTWGAEREVRPLTIGALTTRPPHRFEVLGFFNGAQLISTQPLSPINPGAGGGIEGAWLAFTFLKLTASAAAMSLIPARNPLGGGLIRGTLVFAGIGADGLVMFDWGAVYLGVGIGPAVLMLPRLGTLRSTVHGLVQPRLGVDVHVWRPITLGLRLSYFRAIDDQLSFVEASGRIGFLF